MFISNKTRKCGFRSPSHCKLINEYLEFLQNHQGLAKATVHIREIYVSPFLSALKITTPEELSTLSPSRIHDYVIKTAKLMNRASRKHLVSSLRSFLRFSHIKGLHKQNLVEAVPVISTPRLDRVPRAIPWESVQRLLHAPDRRSRAGRRDYAILQLLATYGLRIGQVTTLKLNDINWQKGLISFSSSKRGRPLCLPLTPEVAQALLSYLRIRGKAPFPEVFLTLNRPPKPIGENNHLNFAMANYYTRAGIHSSTKGSHAIRHAFATRLMEQEVPIKTIADLLGHRCINTTFIYTKVDLKHLRLLAREWPEEAL